MSQSDSTTGTPVAAGASFSALIGRAQVLLNDTAASTWDAQTVAAFLNEAIRDYARHFPRRVTVVVNLTAGVHSAALPADFLAMLSVAYPPGADPPNYLSRLHYRHAAFWSSDGWYDVVPPAGAGAAADLWLSATPTAGQTAVIQYHAAHTVMADPSSPTGTNTVPDDHTALLMKHVLWTATQHLLLAEQQSPAGGSSLLMAQLSQNARRLEAAYHTAVRQALYAADAAHSRTVSWIARGGGLERIY